MLEEKLKGIMSIHSQFIQDLIKVLNLPKHTVKFTLSAEVDEVVIVECLYYPLEPLEDVLFSKKYKLVFEEVLEEKR